MPPTVGSLSPTCCLLQHITSHRSSGTNIHRIYLHPTSSSRSAAGLRTMESRAAQHLLRPPRDHHRVTQLTTITTTAIRPDCRNKFADSGYLVMKRVRECIALTRWTIWAIVQLRQYTWNLRPPGHDKRNVQERKCLRTRTRLLGGRTAFSSFQQR